MSARVRKTERDRLIGRERGRERTNLWPVL